MIAEFFQRLRGARPETPLPELDAQLAVGALLVRLAKSDQHYAVEEIAKIDLLLAQHYGLNPVEAAKTRATCEKLEAQAPDTDEFTAMVQATVDAAARLEVFEALWQVSLADRALKPEEQAFLTGAGTALGISDQDAADITTRLTGA